MTAKKEHLPEEILEAVRRMRSYGWRKYMIASLIYRQYSVRLSGRELDRALQSQEEPPEEERSKAPGPPPQPSSAVGGARAFYFRLREKRRHPSRRGRQFPPAIDCRLSENRTGRTVRPARCFAAVRLSCAAFPGGTG